MNWLESPRTLALGCGLIVITNLALLGAAGWNRQGVPEVELSLTERELAMAPARQEEGGEVMLSLVLSHKPPGVLRRIAARKNYKLPSVKYPWLDRDKLRELGFRVDLDPSDPEAPDYYRHAAMRRAYVVLEYEGDGWSSWLAGREEQVERARREVEEGTMQASALADAEAVLALDRTMRSRLLPVDAGTDADALRQRYPDRRRHAVVEGLFRPQVVRPNDGTPFLKGYLWGLVVRRVHVSRKLRQPLEAFLPEDDWNEILTREKEVAQAGWPSPVAPRYRAVLAVGRRYEPWLVSVAGKSNKSPVQ